MPEDVRYRDPLTLAIEEYVRQKNGYGLRFRIVKLQCGGLP